MNRYKPVRVWGADGFLLKIWDTHRVDRYGKAVLSYELFDYGRLIFKGDDYHCSPLHAIDSDETVAGLLAFLSLKPGDVESEWFESYTPEQMAWCRVRGEALSMFVEELESGGQK